MRCASRQEKNNRRRGPLYASGAIVPRLRRLGAGEGGNLRVDGALADAGLTPEQAAEMYHLLAIARYEDRFVVPTSGRENHDDVWAMKGSEGLAQGEMEERP